MGSQFEFCGERGGMSETWSRAGEGLLLVELIWAGRLEMLRGTWEESQMDDSAGTAWGRILRRNDGISKISKRAGEGHSSSNELRI